MLYPRLVKSGKLIRLVLDTCALIFDALQPEKLPTRAARAIKQAEDAGQLACSDISLWEIAMLV